MEESRADLRLERLPPRPPRRWSSRRSEWMQSAWAA